MTSVLSPARPATSSSLDRAERLGYIILRGRHSDGHRYWQWCQEHNRPLVAVIVRGKTATVGCDMSPLGIQARIFPASMHRIDSLFGWPSSDETGPIDYVHAEGVQADKAETLAFRLFEIVRDCDWPAYQQPGMGTESRHS